MNAGDGDTIALLSLTWRYNFTTYVVLPPRPEVNGCRNTRKATSGWQNKKMKRKGMDHTDSELMTFSERLCRLSMCEKADATCTEQHRSNVKQ